MSCLYPNRKSPQASLSIRSFPVRHSHTESSGHDSFNNIDSLAKTSESTHSIESLIKGFWSYLSESSFHKLPQELAKGVKSIATLGESFQQDCKKVPNSLKYDVLCEFIWLMTRPPRLPFFRNMEELPAMWLSP